MYDLVPYGKKAILHFQVLQTAGGTFFPKCKACDFTHVYAKQKAFTHTDKHHTLVEWRGNPCEKDMSLIVLNVHLKNCPATG